MGTDKFLNGIDIYGKAIIEQLSRPPTFAQLATPEGKEYLEKRRQQREVKRQERIKNNPPDIQIEALGWESEGLVVTCATCDKTLERENSALPYEELKKLVEAHTCE